MDDFNDLMNTLTKFDKIIVYGTGHVANAFTETFKNTGLYLKIKYYATSDFVPDDSNFYGVPIKRINDLKEYKDSALIIIATSDKYYFEIEEKLKRLKFCFIMDFTFESKNLSILRGKYFIDFFDKRNEKFNFFNHEKKFFNDKSNVHNYKIFMIKSHVDSKIKSEVHDKYAEYLLPLQVGKALTNLSIATYQDNTGDNISQKNENYCELTGHYWLWKNVNTEWIGICHYRRHFELIREDIENIINFKYDVVLPIPIVNIPNVATIYKEDHEKSDWELMMSILREMRPDYCEAAEEIFNDVYYCAYNMMIVKKAVFDDYCAWLFPLLFEIEKRASKVRNDKYQKRYIGFLAERLTSLYFVCNRKKMNILFANIVFYR